ncbi:MAG: hypothetical protein JWM88_1872 [Verrucomicrobia bacterium]|nr:hypothetical protein [Verrucomicrobiota bacterium]
MKNTHKLLALAAAVTALATSAFASTLVLNTNAYTDSYGGGEFTVNGSGLSTSAYAASTLLNGGFETFCMEYGEHFSPGGTYSYTLGSAATGGDLPSGSDPISAGTAWLYSQFAKGTLVGYSYATTGTTRMSSALDLQLAFWYLEDETGTTPAYTTFAADHPGFNPSTNIFITSALAQFGGLSGAKADANGMFGVSVLNLTSNEGQTNNQSQLYLNNVPESGATIALLGLAMVGLAGFRRKASK